MKMWIARNSDNTLVLFKTKPKSFKEEGVGQYWAGGYAYLLPVNQFPEITFENSPMEVELKLIETLKNMEKVCKYSSEESQKMQMEWRIPDGYQFKDENGNVINATRIVLEKMKKEYPKTYEECWYLLKHDPNFDKAKGYKSDILSALQKLLICRDAYWKLYGKEMGLGKPWEPDWKTQEEKYAITYICDELKLGTFLKTKKILAFPLHEMRDAFYENFKELIEQCKELL